ncbi:MAG: aldo/keto reductase, partial [Treponema sp.]|nr:aldo/keto reductase [Treponema sp.]
RREQAVIQGHIGSIRKDGQYAMSRELAECKEAFNDLLARLGTNYIDIGMLHFIDTNEDFDAVFNGELIAYAKELKEKGIIRAIGFDTHITSLAKRAVETGIIDVVMFSLNPAFDLLPGDMELDDMFIAEKLHPAMQNYIDPGRMELYQLCEQKGVAITVMKTYMAGQLLDASQSPFGLALSPVQCIHYALTRPGVASAIIGCVTSDEIRQAMAYETATSGEKDFSAVFGKTFTAQGKCVYCNHCLPCPVQIDIGQANKYLDLAKVACGIPETIKAHYNALQKRAGDCIHCGNCEERCPFGVAVRERMLEMVMLFGK